MQWKQGSLLAAQQLQHTCKSASSVTHRPTAVMPAHHHMPHFEALDSVLQAGHAVEVLVVNDVAHIALHKDVPRGDTQELVGLQRQMGSKGHLCGVSQLVLHSSSPCFPSLLILLMPVELLTPHPAMPPPTCRRQASTHSTDSVAASANLDVPKGHQTSLGWVGPSSRMWPWHTYEPISQVQHSPGPLSQRTQSTSLPATAGPVRP